MVEEKKNWFRRHWIWTAIICIFLLSAIIGAFNSNTNSPSNSNSSSGTKTISGESANSVVSGNLESFFPTREEIPTEFDSGTITDLGISNILNLKQAKSMSMESIVGSGVISLDINIYEFLSQDTAQSYYDSLVNEQKQAGGYTGMGVSSQSTCFGFTEDQGISGGQFAKILCYNKNIYFEVDGVSVNTLKKPDSNVKTMLSVIDGKIK